MITKKLMHDVQSWLNSLYDFKNKDDDRNKHIISSIENFAFKFIGVNIRIWILRKDGSFYSLQKSYTTSIVNTEDFIKFKNEVNSTIDDYIKIAIDETNKNKENGNRT